MTVNVPLARAWHHFARAADWPSWHTDLKRVEVSPAGELGARSVAALFPQKGPTAIFRMTEFVPYDHWTWVAKALWLTIQYDHRFEQLDADSTRITLHIEIGGLGKSLFARWISAAANRSLDKALPRLAAEMKATGAAKAGDH